MTGLSSRFSREFGECARADRAAFAIGALVLAYALYSCARFALQDDVRHLLVRIVDDASYYMTTARSEFNWILHFVFPIGTSLILIYSVYAAFNPFPAYPNSLSPWIVLVWLALGVVILLWMRMTGNEAWLAKAGEIITEREETAAEEARGRPL